MVLVKNLFIVKVQDSKKPRSSNRGLSFSNLTNFKYFETICAFTNQVSSARPQWPVSMS